MKESVSPLPAESPGQTEASPEFDSGRNGCGKKVFDKYHHLTRTAEDLYDELIFKVSRGLSGPFSKVNDYYSFQVFQGH